MNAQCLTGSKETSVVGAILAMEKVMRELLVFGSSSSVASNVATT